MNKKVIYFFLLVLSVGLFSACSDDDDDKKDNAAKMQGTYKGDMTISIPSLPFEQTSLRKVLFTRVGKEKVNIKLKDFSFAIDGVNEVPIGDIDVNNILVSKKGDSIKIAETSTIIRILDAIDAKVTINGGTKGSKIGLQMQIEIIEDEGGGAKADGGLGIIYADFDGSKMAQDNEKTESKIIGMTFDEEIVTSQPVINTELNTIVFSVADTARAEHLEALKPIMEISDKAKVEPESGESVDFSEGDPITFTVTAEDGIHKTVYMVSRVIDGTPVPIQ